MRNGHKTKKLIINIKNNSVKYKTLNFDARHGLQKESHQTNITAYCRPNLQKKKNKKK